MTEPPFYVGYLRLPPGLRGFVLRLVAGILVLDAVVALAVFILQPPHPTGSWGIEGEVAYQGIFTDKPTALLRVPGQKARTIILVGEGKHGAPAGLEGLEGKWVEARGYPLFRGDLVILQLDATPSAVMPSAVMPSAAMPSAAAPAANPLDAVHEIGPATLKGEIVDTKCWAGAMNPGEGKAHKACASLCLLGNIPPLFVTKAGNGAPSWYVLAGEDGGSVGDLATRPVGDSVTLSGQVSVGDGIQVFSVPRARLAALP